MRNKKGFTLVELLVVITLLGVLGLITVPIINDVIKNSRKKAFRETIINIVEVAKIYNAENDYFAITNGESIDMLSNKLEYDNKTEIKRGTIYFEDGEYYVEAYGEYYCALGNVENLEIYDVDDCERPPRND